MPGILSLLLLLKERKKSGAVVKMCRWISLCGLGGVVRAGGQRRSKAIPGNIVSLSAYGTSFPRIDNSSLDF